MLIELNQDGAGKVLVNVNNLAIIEECDEGCEIQFMNGAGNMQVRETFAEISDQYTKLAALFK